MVRNTNRRVGKEINSETVSKFGEVSINVIGEGLFKFCEVTDSFLDIELLRIRHP